jgi:predicted metal-dependent peptidase
MTTGMESMSDNEIKEFAKQVAEALEPLSKEEIAEASHRVSVARARLLEWLPFLGYITLKMTVHISTVVPTAAVTPDAQMFVNPRFIKDLSDNELCGLLCHEVLHPAFMFFERKGNRNIRLFNIAHDYVINQIILDMVGKDGRKTGPFAIRLPPKGLVSDQYATRDQYGSIDGYMSAEEIYDLLKQEMDEQDGDGEDEGEGDGEDDRFGGIGQDARPDLAKDKNPGEAERKRREEYWKQTLMEALQVNERSKYKGTLPGNLQKLVEEILEPKVDWPMALARWVGENGKRSDYTYRRPSRRSAAAGAILPSLVKHGVADVIVLWDTSGSMNGREKEILGEVIGICNDLAMTLRVVCCDMAICSDVSDVESYEDIKDEIKGGGGSNFIPAFDLFREEGWDGVVVAFTDGCIDVPSEQPECIRGVLWVIQEGDRAPTSSWGDCIQIRPDGTVKL